MKTIIWTLFLSLIPHLALAVFNGQIPLAEDPIFRATAFLKITYDRSEIAPSERVKGINKYSSYCSGILIQPNVVLTAAHCVSEKKSLPQDIKASFKQDTVSGFKFSSVVQKVFMHPEFKMKLVDGTDMVDDLKNDLAILILKTPAPVANKPISVGPFSVIAENQEYQGYLGGYGKKSPTDKKLGYFRKSITDFQIVSFNQKSFLMSQGRAEGFSGDSGSGLFYFQAVSDNPIEDVVVLVGVLSTVFPRNGTTESTYEYLKNYQTWIRSVLAKHSKQTAFATPTADASQDRL
jgi:hypothetical protein